MTRGLLLLLLFFSCAGSAHAAERRVALVVGNSAYVRQPLTNPRNDAAAMATALRGLGFEVIEGLDLDRRATGDKLKEFGRKLEGAGVGLFYYAGHGLQVNGTNYLVPVDSPMRDIHDLDDTLSLDQVQTKLEQKQRTNLLFVDACRDNPFEVDLKGASRGLRSTGRGGLASVRAGSAGTFIAFATDPNETADDGAGDHSPFTAALLKHLPTPGLEVNGLLTRVRNDVLDATKGEQTPWSLSSLRGEFYFKPQPGVVTEETESLVWDRVRNDAEPERLIAFLRLYPESQHTGEARSRLRELATAEAPGGDSGKKKAPDPLDRAAQKLLAEMPPVARLVSGGFTYGDTRMPTACGRSLAEKVGAALGGTVAIANRDDADVAVRGGAGAGAGGPGSATTPPAAGERLGLPATDAAWLLEGRYTPNDEGVDLSFQLVGRRGAYDSPPVAVVLERGSPCFEEEAPPSSPLTSDLNRGRLRLELASPYGSNPVYTVRDPPERVELQLRVNAPAHLYCFNRDEGGRIQKLLPNEGWPETRVDAGEVVILPTGLKSKGGTTRWLAKTPEVGILKCFASDRPLPLPGALGDVDGRSEPLRGMNDEALLKAVRGAAGRGGSLSEASVVYAVLPE